METSSPYRYQQLADLIVGMVDKGTLAPGARLPSVRAFSEQHRISISTALQAYRLLEDRGILVARPQSGFYVATARRGTLALPSTPRARARASTVSISGAVAGLLEHAANSALVPLGCAVPDPALLESKRLDLALARVARQQGMRYNVYSPPYGDPRLRQEIAKRAMRFGHALAPDDVLVTNGCTEALTLALSAVARPGDTIAVESPTYFGLLHTLEVLGLKALELPTDPTRGIDIGVLAGWLETGSVSACVLSSTFSNPLGATMAETDKRALLALLAAHRVPLIEDDVYGDIHFGGKRPTPFIAVDGGADTIYCSSFSKSLAPGDQPHRKRRPAIGTTRRSSARPLRTGDAARVRAPAPPYPTITRCPGSICAGFCAKFRLSCRISSSATAIRRSLVICCCSSAGTLAAASNDDS
ncbi:GntR family transcriptional regulator [Burkholderia pseudomultivorans]|uniref:GntR family transcriptional regulator n=1 Tax=Burkholderia pseudomultivorans TaxID=1207504 RepID=A0A6P2IGA6_9BURK|nr:PLP-dependent aminotransferase family protein [Burkholderia pseudomultivorans]VWB29923.1 GntR family transcriptional regulator [Burkholderia pseudomultivorans]